SVMVIATALAFGCARKKEEPQVQLPPPPPAQAPTPPAQPSNPLDWRAYSADGQTSLEQKGNPDGSCKLTASRDGKTLWTSTDCVGQRADMRFISKDGERVVVLHPYPQGSTNDWRQTEVAHVYRHSKLEWAVKAGGVIQDPRHARISGSSV